MSKRSIREKIPSDHHTIPSSLGGTDHPINLITGIESRMHGEYHAWTGNMPPCFAYRRALVEAIGGKFCPEPDVLENGLQITTMPDWQELYDGNAHSAGSKLGGREKAEKAASFQVTLWKEEEVLIRKTMHALLNGVPFPNALPEGRRFESALFLSMRADNVRDALKRLLTQKHTKGRLMWVNPMHEVTRESLLRWTNAMPPKTKISEPKKGTARDEFERVLNEQLKHLASYERMRNEEQERWAKKPYIIGPVVSPIAEPTT